MATIYGTIDGYGNPPPESTDRILVHDKTGRKVELEESRPNLGGLSAPLFSPDSMLVAAGHSIYSVTTGKRVVRWGTGRWGTGTYTVYALTWSPDGRYLYAGGGTDRNEPHIGKPVLLAYDRAKGKITNLSYRLRNAEEEGGVNEIYVKGDRQYVVTTTRAYKMTRWRATSCRLTLENEYQKQLQHEMR